MADSPSANNTAASIVDGIVNDTIMDAAVPLVESAAIAEFPWLAAPVVEPFFHDLVDFFAGKFSRALQTMATHGVITIQTNRELASVDSGQIELEAAIQKGDPDAVNQAKRKLAAAFKDLVGWDGSSPPV